MGTVGTRVLAFACGLAVFLILVLAANEVLNPRNSTAHWLAYALGLSLGLNIILAVGRRHAR
jgi:hypothetical protein